jgi:hypothetical protein
VALKAIFDAILAFGVDAFRPPAPLDEQGVVEETEFTTPTSTPVQDSRSKTVVQLLLPYVIPQHRCPLIFLTLLLQQCTHTRHLRYTTLYSRYMHNDDEGIRTIAVEGFARLMLQNHVTCPSICSQLVELYVPSRFRRSNHWAIQIC